MSNKVTWTAVHILVHGLNICLAGIEALMRSEASTQNFWKINILAAENRRGKVFPYLLQIN